MDTLLGIDENYPPSFHDALGIWSPPDSGSETPLSPDQLNGSIPSSLGQDSSPEMISHSGHQDNLKHPYVPYNHHHYKHQSHMSHHPSDPLNNQLHACHPVSQSHPSLNFMLMYHQQPQSSHLSPLHPMHQNDAQILSQHMSPGIMNGHSGVMSGQMQQQVNHVPNGIPQHLPPHYPGPPPPAPEPEFRPMPSCNGNDMTEGPAPMPQSTGGTGATQKKRKASELSSKGSPESTASVQNVVHIKRDPGDNGRATPEGPTSTLTTQCEDDFGFGYNGGGGDGPGSVYGLGPEYQCIRFQAFLQQNWHTLLDSSFKEVPVNYRVDADKGFNYSNLDEAFVCQKKNHFQVTVHVMAYGQPRFVKTPEGPKKVDQFFIHFYGCKTESPTQTIKVEQSQSDRSKKPFHPQPIDIVAEQATKTTVGRLHFSETTSNNMRKKGKPNPDQRYFHLVVTLAAHVGSDQVYHIVSHASERIIVRASNPGQFENDLELSWQKGSSPESIFHAGRVGINTDRPDEPLVVHGNVKVTGHIIQPSDQRAKSDITELDTKEQLRNVASMRIVKYNFKSEFAGNAGLKGENVKGTGVLAQEVQKIIPDAVKTAGDVHLSNGETIENFLVVNNDRIFMENVGAVKELCKVTDNLETRIDELERMNNRLRKINRFDSIKSVVSSSSVASASTVTCNSSYTGRKHGDHRRCQRTQCLHKDSRLCRGCRNGSHSSQKDELCSNRFMQSIIMILVLIMAFCLAAMATLYILEYHKRHNQLPPLTTHGAAGQPYYVLPVNNNHSPPTFIHPPPNPITIDPVPSPNNAIHAPSHEKSPATRGTEKSQSGYSERVKPPPDVTPAPTRPQSTSSKRPATRAPDAQTHRFTSTQTPVVNPFNDLNDNGKGVNTHKVAEDLGPEVPKILSNGVGNGLSQSDREAGV